MSSNWKKAYQELKEYILANPSISIEKTSVSIPSDVRPGFYRLFDKVRVSFLENKCQLSLNWLMD
jgi:hypothetical protein